MTLQGAYPLADLELARRLERTEAQSNIDFVEARASAFPESGARWIEDGGGFAMFDGAESPLTQTFCLGIFETLTAKSLDRVEEFYSSLEAPAFHEVSPLVDADSNVLLNARGYEPFEFTSVMYMPIAKASEVRTSSKVQARVVAGTDDLELWAQTMAGGWSEMEGMSDFMLSFGRVNARKKSGSSFLAELDGKPIAAGGLTIHAGVALFAGASTIPEGRRQGAQTALLEARLRFAAEQGCDIAMMCALPGSASQRNAERQGFRIAYTRIKWRRRSHS